MLSAIINIALIMTIYSKKGQMKDSKKQLEEANNKLENYLEEKISHIQKIQELTTKIEQTENIKKDTLEAARETLLETSSKLTQHLLSSHKHESEKAKEDTEKTIRNTTNTLLTEVKTLISGINILKEQVNSSTNSVEDLKSALLNPISSGNLTEITLANLLESSGLKSYMDYNLQHSFISENNMARPDAIIKLPDKGLLIIDAKASKLSKESEELMLRSMNTHIKSLSSKDYKQKIINSANYVDPNNIITIMFVMHESVIEKLQNLDKEFINKAWQHNIFPVGPTGLMNILKMASYKINQAVKAENYDNILKEISNIMHSITTLAQHGDKLSGSIQSVVTNYDKFASSFNRNLLSKAGNLEKLGLLPDKEIKNLKKIGNNEQ